MRFPMVQPVTEMTKAALGDLLSPGVRGYLDMFHEEAVFEFPYGLDGPIRKSGKAEMTAYLADLEGHVTFDPFRLDAAHSYQGGMILEYGSRVRPRGGLEPYEQRYVAVIGVSNGRIDHYREYFDPLAPAGASVDALRSPVPNHIGLLPTGTLLSVLREALPNLAPVVDFLQAFTEDAVIECPFAPAGAMHRLDGKAAIALYLKRLAQMQQSDGMCLTRAYHDKSRGTYIIEYSGIVRNVMSNARTRQNYLAIVETRDGLLSYFKEYWNPAPVVRLFGEAGPSPVI